MSAQDLVYKELHSHRKAVRAAGRDYLEMMRAECELEIWLAWQRYEMTEKELANRAPTKEESS